MTKRLACFLLAAHALPSLVNAQVTALRVGHLVDPETGTASANQIILIDAGKFTAIAPNVAIPQGAEVIDLSQYYVIPGRAGRLQWHHDDVWRVHGGAGPRQ